nr:hypothetical protein [Tanacetum cinerariifolium]
MGIRIPQSNVATSVADKAITKEMHDGLGRATTTAYNLEAEQGSCNISKTQTKATPSGISSPRTSSKGYPVCHITIKDSPVQARPERLSNLPNEPPLKEEIKMLFDNTMESIRKFVPMESAGQVANSKAREGSLKEGESLKRPTEEELGHEQEDEEEIVQQEDVVAEQAEKKALRKLEED